MIYFLVLLFLQIPLSLGIGVNCNNDSDCAALSTSQITFTCRHGYCLKSTDSGYLCSSSSQCLPNESCISSICMSNASGSAPTSSSSSFPAWAIAVICICVSAVVIGAILWVCYRRKWLMFSPSKQSTRKQAHDKYISQEPAVTEAKVLESSASPDKRSLPESHGSSEWSLNTLADIYNVDKLSQEGETKAPEETAGVCAEERVSEPTVHFTSPAHSFSPKVPEESASPLNNIALSSSSNSADTLNAVYSNHNSPDSSLYTWTKYHSNQDSASALCSPAPNSFNEILTSNQSYSPHTTSNPSLSGQSFPRSPLQLISGSVSPFYLNPAHAPQSFNPLSQHLGSPQSPVIYSVPAPVYISDREREEEIRTAERNYDRFRKAFT